MKKLTGNKTQKIPIGDSEDCYLLVNFDWEVIKHPKHVIECHGLHEFSEDDVIFFINYASVHLCNSPIKTWMKDELDFFQRTAIENLLSIED